ncbi:MAG: patatin-like phospholipase family protein [Phycisphaerales bacterium]|nr:patatin-like phospholipase family protein [Phycisphaerales bacterium]
MIARFYGYSQTVRSSGDAAGPLSRGCLLGRVGSLCALVLLMVTVVTAAPGCAVNRPTQTTAQLQALLEQYRTNARNETQLANTKMIQRIRMEEDEYLAATAAGAAAERPTFDLLILSGGGDFGAFGAGFLQGWGKVTDASLKRPVFDAVSGVSTGSLIAPFAFVGDDRSYEQLLKLYTSPKDDWFLVRGLLFFLPGNESFLRNDGLRRDLEEQIGREVVTAVARESGKNRVLQVNATNLDVGGVHPFEWSMQAELAVAGMENDDPAPLRRLHDILLASTAIPAVFPPVVIDNALYVDGGVTSNILYGANWRSPRAPFRQWMERYPGEPLPKIRFWVIVNNQLEVGPQTVQPQWMEIVKASMGTAIRASTATSLRHLATQVALLREADKWDVEFRYVAIPSTWTPPNTNQFDKDVMKSLADLGLEMGADPKSWKTDFSN